MKRFPRFAAITATALTLTFGFAGSAAADDEEDDPCEALIADICEMCGPDACAAVESETAEPHECIEARELIDGVMTEMEALGDEAQEAFLTEFCASVAGDDDEE